MNFINIIKNVEFCKLWVGQMFAHFADAVVQIALIAWIISFLDIAGKEIATVFFFFLLPQFLLSPFTGAISDKFNRKQIMFISNIYRAVLILIATACVKFVPSNFETSNLLAIIYILAFGLGFGYTFFYSAKMPCMTNVVKPSQLKLANTINSGSINFLNIFGAAVAGFGVTYFGLIKILIMTIGLYIVASVLFLNIKMIYQQKYNDKFNSVFNDVKSAVLYISKHKITLQIILLSVSVSLIIGTFTNALNSLTVDEYRLGIYGITKFRIMMGVGIILGMILTFMLARVRQISYIFSFSFFILFLTLFTSHLCKTINMAWFWLVPIGISSVIIMVMIDTVLQKSVPDYIRGKVFGFQLTLNTLAFLSGSYLIMTLNMQPLDIMKILGVISFIYTIIIVIFSLKKADK